MQFLYINPPRKKARNCHEKFRERLVGFRGKPKNIMRLIYKDEVYGIIGACFDVYKELSSGLSEPIYQEALELEFKSRGIPYEREKELVAQS